MSELSNPNRPAPSAPRPYRFPDFTRNSLDNGLTVWLVPVAGSSLTSVHLLIDAGAAAEDESHGGVASLTARLLVTGTRRLDAAAFAAATERLGIEVNSESSWDSSRAGFQSLPQHLDAGMALLAEMVQLPRFDPDEFSRLKAERLAAILQMRADAGALADESFIKHLYDAGTPYHRLAGGSPEMVETLVVDDVRAHHATHHRPGHAHLVIAGAFDGEKALRLAEQHLGGWSGSGPGHRTITPAAAGGRRVVIVDRPGSVQSELRIGLVGINRYDPRYFSAAIMSTYLGGSFGSRINLRLREELGYTYGARCGFDPRRAAGPFSAAAAVQTEVSAPAIAELLVLLETAGAAPPTSDELRQAQDYQIGVFPLRFETTGGIAAALEPIAIYELTDDYWQTYRDHLEAVDAASAQQAAAELIRPTELLVVAVGDASIIRADIEALGVGPVEVVPAP